MSYLSRLKEMEKVATPPTAKTAKSQNEETEKTAKTAKTPFYPFCSSPDRRFSENKIELPNWCSLNCPRLEIVPLASGEAIPGCLSYYNDITEWRRLELMSGCPGRPI